MFETYLYCVFFLEAVREKIYCREKSTSEKPTAL